MGGGGNTNYDSRIIDRLEKVAKDSFKTAEPERRNVFISFSYEDLNDVNLLRGQAKNDNNNLEFIDFSLKEPFNSERAEYIKNGIRERIRQSSVTLVYLSENTGNSQWVNWEVKESIAMGKGVICVHKADAPKSMPQFVKDHKLKVVKWSHDELTKAIDDAAKNR